MTMNRFRLGSLCLALFTLVALTGASVSRAQSTTQGAIAGSVLDSTGAAVPGATVSILNMATNFTESVVSDASGYFKAPLLEPGNYTVLIKAPNFANFEADRVVVVVGQVTSLLPHLSVASSSTQIVVSEQTPVMNLESPDFTSTLDNKSLQSIPINNKRWSALAMTTPGVVSDASGYGLVSVRGISALLNDVEIDGADDNQAFFSEERGRTREAYSTTFAAVREFAVNSGVYSAQYGRAAGGVVTSVTRSGTNQLHGQAYFWDRESNWAAYNEYATITNFVNGENVTSPLKPEDLRKIYGFTVGGALKKDKLFWMYTFDQHVHLLNSIGYPYNNSVFYTLPSALPAGDTCILTGTHAGEVQNASGTAVSANSLPVNDLDNCALAARQGGGNGSVSYTQAAYDWAALTLGTANASLSNYPGATSLPFSDLGILSDVGQSPRFGYQEINMPKLDWQINPKNRWSIVYNRLRWDSPGGVQTTNPVHYAPDAQGNDFVKLDYGVTTLTTILSANLSNQVLYQYSRELDDETNQKPDAYTLTDVNNNSGNLPEVEEYNDGITFGSPYYGYRKAYPLENKWQVSDVLYWNKGNHSLTFGGEFVHNYDLMNNTYESNGVWDYDWDGNYFNDLINFRKGITPSSTNQVGCASSANENTTSASLVGTYTCAYEFVQGFGPPVYAISTLDSGLFVQDSWKISPRLTLDLGLRWDKETIPGYTSSFTSATGSYVPYVGLLNNPDENRAFGPRVGFAYNVYGSGKTVLRGGWGMYYGRITNGNIENVRLETGSPNGQYTTLWKPTSSYSGTPVYPNVVTGGAAAATPTSYFFAPNLKLPEVQEFDLAIQQAVGKGTVFAISYLGALGRELPNFLDVNLNPATTAPATLTVTEDANGQGPLGANGATLTVPVVYTSYGNTTDPELQAIGGSGSAAANYQAITEMVSNVNSNYNAIVAEVLNRSLHSVQFDFNYTWAHALDFAQNASTQGASNSWYDPYSDARVNYGNSSWDVPNRFVAYALYNVPGIHQTNLLKWLTNGWSLDDSFQMQNGLPFTAGVSGYPSSIPNPTPGGKTLSGLLSDLNGASGSSLIPQVGYNSYRYPREMVDDARVQKSFDFEKSRSLDLSVDSYNLANHQNTTGFEESYLYYISGLNLQYQGPDGADAFMVRNAANSSGFLYTPRQIEITARFNF